MASTAGSTAVLESETFELEITRVFDAPRALVWRAWTDPAMASQWQAPKTFVVPLMEQDVQVGGRWRKHMRGTRPGGSAPVDLWQRGVYREVRPPELLVYTFAWESRAAAGLTEDGDPHETMVTVRLEESAGKTTMYFHQTAFPTVQERDGHHFGWSSGFEQLETLLAKLQ